MKRTRRTKKTRAPNGYRVPLPGSRAALDKLDGAILCTLSASVGTPYAGVLQHNIAIAARAATDLRGLLTMREILDDGTVES